MSFKSLIIVSLLSIFFHGCTLDDGKIKRFNDSKYLFISNIEDVEYIESLMNDDVNINRYFTTYNVHFLMKNIKSKESDGDLYLSQANKLIKDDSSSDDDSLDNITNQLDKVNTLIKSDLNKVFKVESSYKELINQAPLLIKNFKNKLKNLNDNVKSDYSDYSILMEQIVLSSKKFPNKNAFFNQKRDELIVLLNSILESKSSLMRLEKGVLDKDINAIFALDKLKVRVDSDIKEFNNHMKETSELLKELSIVKNKKIIEVSSKKKFFSTYVQVDSDKQPIYFEDSDVGVKEVNKKNYDYIKSKESAYGKIKSNDVLFLEAYIESVYFLKFVESNNGIDSLPIEEEISLDSYNEIKSMMVEMNTDSLVVESKEIGTFMDETSDAVVPTRDKHYAHVGNPNYGHWEKDSSGSNVWMWLAIYGMFNNGNSYYYSDYDRYRSINRNYGYGSSYNNYENRDFNNRYGNNSNYNSKRYKQEYKKEKKYSSKTNKFSKSSFSGKKKTVLNKAKKVFKQRNNASLKKRNTYKSGGKIKNSKKIISKLKKNKKIPKVQQSKRYNTKKAKVKTKRNKSYSSSKRSTRSGFSRSSRRRR
jgi:hypothetical protein